jgi:hypothetical protein
MMTCSATPSKGACEMAQVIQLEEELADRPAAVQTTIGQAVAPPALVRRACIADKPASLSQDFSRSRFHELHGFPAGITMPRMNVGDRDYFMLRARQERLAARDTLGVVRGRHEELAWLYEMRVIYIDRGLVGDETEDANEGVQVQHIVVPTQ